MATKNVLDPIYQIYDQRTHALYKIQENADVPGVTDIIQVEGGKEVGRVTFGDEDIGLFIEALQRRLEDSKRNNPAQHSE